MNSFKKSSILIILKFILKIIWKSKKKNIYIAVKFQVHCESKTSSCIECPISTNSEVIFKPTERGGRAPVATRLSTGVRTHSSTSYLAHHTGPVTQCHVPTLRPFFSPHHHFPNPTPTPGEMNSAVFCCPQVAICCGLQPESSFPKPKPTVGVKLPFSGLGSVYQTVGSLPQVVRRVKTL